MASQAAEGRIYALEPPAELGLVQVAERLRAADLLPAEGTWWFAWRVAEIQLPAALGDLAKLGGEDWDVARVFSARAELRLGRQGQRRRWWLLMEEDLDDALAKALGAAEVGRYRAETAETDLHVLAGTSLTLPDGQGGTVARRGEIRYPRSLGYELGAVDDVDQALVADVWHYWHLEQGTRRATRYRGLRLVANKAKHLVPPYPMPEDCHATAS